MQPFHPHHSTLNNNNFPQYNQPSHHGITHQPIYEYNPAWNSHPRQAEHSPSNHQLNYNQINPNLQQHSPLQPINHPSFPSFPHSQQHSPSLPSGFGSSAGLPVGPSMNAQLSAAHPGLKQHTNDHSPALNGQRSPVFGDPNRGLASDMFDGPFVDRTNFVGGPNTYGTGHSQPDQSTHNSNINNSNFNPYHHSQQQQQHQMQQSQAPIHRQGSFSHPSQSPVLGREGAPNSAANRQAAEPINPQPANGQSAASALPNGIVRPIPRRHSAESSTHSSRAQSPAPAPVANGLTAPEAVAREGSAQAGATSDGAAAAHPDAAKAVKAEQQQSVASADKSPAQQQQAALAETPAPAAGRARVQTGGGEGEAQRTPNQAEDSTEAAMHLLRLALPGNSTGGSVATNGTEVDSRIGDDLDAEGEEVDEHQSDDTSVHSGDALRSSALGLPAADARLWNHDDKREPLRIPVQARPTSHQNAHSRQPSITSSHASTRRRQHIPARTEREQSVAASATGSSGSRRDSGGAPGSMAAPDGRRTSGRVRKPVVPAGDDSLYENENSIDSGVNVSPIDEDMFDSDGSESGGGSYSYAGSATKGKGKAKAPPKARSAARAKTGKRASMGGPTVGAALGPPTAKKPRMSAPAALDRAPAAPRQPRRVVPPPTNAGQRTFPAEVEVHPAFPRFYRQFPLSSRFPPDSTVHTGPIAQHPIVVAGSALVPTQDTKWNKVSDPLNLYIARVVQGNAEHKAGLCPICVEPAERGGEGAEKWLKLKNSSYVYHLSYAHGLSNLTGKPFSPPVKTRQTPMPPGAKDSRSEMTEGLCHKCHAWVPLLSVKNVDAIVPELLWWKHAKKCHSESTIQGEGDPFLHDEVYDLLVNGGQGSGSNQASAHSSAAASVHGSAHGSRQLSATGSADGLNLDNSVAGVQQSRSASPAGSHASRASSMYPPTASPFGDGFQSPYGQDPRVYGHQAQAGWHLQGQQGASGQHAQVQHNTQAMYAQHSPTAQHAPWHGQQ